MGRFAILIESSNVKGQNDLPGARTDVQSWVNFLQSYVGGAWSTSEIKILHKPQLSEVEVYLRIFANDYCFVVFSGHGCEHNKKQYVCLNDNETAVCLDSLRPRGRYGTLISDTCRGVVSAMQRNASQRSFAMADTLSLSESANRSFVEERLRLHQSLWTKKLDEYCKNSQGIVTMYSCSTGQSAGEDANAGGLYTSLLIKFAEFWYSSAIQNSCRSTYEIHQDAMKWMRENSPQQIPEYIRYPWQYPFAVRA